MSIFPVCHCERMEPLIAAAEEAGFERRVTYHKMGIEFS